MARTTGASTARARAGGITVPTLLLTGVSGGAVLLGALAVAGPIELGRGDSTGPSAHAASGWQTPTWDQTTNDAAHSTGHVRPDAESPSPTTVPVDQRRPDRRADPAGVASDGANWRTISVAETVHRLPSWRTVRRVPQTTAAGDPATVPPPTPDDGRVESGTDPIGGSATESDSEADDTGLSAGSEISTAYPHRAGTDNDSGTEESTDTEPTGRLDDGTTGTEDDDPTGNPTGGDHGSDQQAPDEPPVGRDVGDQPPPGRSIRVQSTRDQPVPFEPTAGPAVPVRPTAGRQSALRQADGASNVDPRGGRRAA